MDKYRSPDWRYRECQKCIEDNVHPRGDYTLRRLHTYLREQAKPLGTPRETFRKQYRDIARAHQIWKDVTSTSPRWIIEAYALTDMIDRDIAEELMEDPWIISTYLNCFFDVRDKFSKAKYIKGMRNFFCSYEHSYFPHMGFKYIIVTKGREIFDKIITNRSNLTSTEMEFFRSESKKNRVIKVWSKSWESLNPNTALGEFDIKEIGSYIDSDRQDEKAEQQERAKLPPAVGIGIKAVFQHVRIQMLNTIDRNLSPVEERLIKIK